MESLLSIHLVVLVENGLAEVLNSGRVYAAALHVVSSEPIKRILLGHRKSPDQD